MTEVLLGAAVLAGLACPLHAMWRWRRGRSACCGAEASNGPEAVAARQRALASRVRSVTASGPGGGVDSD